MRVFHTTFGTAKKEPTKRKLLARGCQDPDKPYFYQHDLVGKEDEVTEAGEIEGKPRTFGAAGGKKEYTERR